MKKSRDAFRTISEVADWLEVPTHVLRFWESRFTQVKPVKRAGGRRYYRPSDMELIGGIKTLLHDDGMTIRGVQKLLREEGVKHVAGYSKPVFRNGEDADEDGLVDVSPAPAPAAAAKPAPQPAVEDAEVVDETAQDEPQDLAYEMEPGEERASEDTVEPAPSLPGFGSVRTQKPEGVDEPAAAKPMVLVPDEDPADDDPAFERSTGVAARLKLRKGAVPAEALREAHTKLTALRDRMDAAAK